MSRDFRVFLLGVTCAFLWSANTHAETPTVCRAYAQGAVAAFVQSGSGRCRSGPRWHGDYNAHYNWCLAAPSVWVKSEEQFRGNELKVCLGEPKAVECQKYAILADSDQKSNVSGRCGFTGARWQENFDQHMAWCMGTPNFDVVNFELNVRTSMLGVCAHQEPYARCDAYARQALAQADEANRRGCGFTGLRWTANYEQHLTWCIGAEAGQADSETRQREGPLSQCRTLNPLGPAAPSSEACLWTSVASNRTCTNIDGTPSQILSPGSRTANGCGSTAQASADRAKLNLAGSQMCLTEDSAPENGCCLYNVETHQGCGCP